MTSQVLHIRKRLKSAMQQIALAFVLLLALPSAYAAETPAEKAKADFQKVNALYAVTPSYSLDIQYTVFDSHTGGNLVEQKSGKYLKQREQSYSKLLEVETITNSKHTIVVNHEDRFVVIADTKRTEISPLQNDVGELLKQCRNITVKDLGTNERYYSFLFSDDEGQSEFSQVEIVINLSNYSIKKMVLYYNQSLPLNENDYAAKEKKPRLEIVYKTFTASSVFPASLFAEGTYLEGSGNTYRGRGKQASYEVINQLQSVRFKKN